MCFTYIKNEYQYTDSGVQKYGVLIFLQYSQNSDPSIVAPVGNFISVNNGILPSLPILRGWGCQDSTSLKQWQGLWRRDTANQPIIFCPHGPFMPDGQLLFLVRLKTSVPIASAPQMLYPNALPLWGLAPTWPLPGSRTHRTCSSPQLEGFHFHLLFPHCVSRPLSFSQTLPSPWASGF